jgi:predicted dithiol-disulfide oxidoreductase (DUF899 family)
MYLWWRRADRRLSEPDEETDDHPDRCRVSEQEWNSQHEALLVKEKELTRARDALAAERRRLPMVRVEKEYRFEGSQGEVSLLDLFEGRRQLIVYRFFLDPGMDIAKYPEQGCPGCTMFADNLPNLTHVNARDTTLVFVSAGSQEAIRNYRARMGWADWPWYTTLDDFSADFDVSQWFGINVFLRERPDLPQLLHDRPGRRGAQQRPGATGHPPFGRQEEWQDAPEGVPQDPTGSWTRRHDDYSPEELAGGRTS